MVIDRPIRDGSLLKNATQHFVLGFYFLYVPPGLISQPLTESHQSPLTSHFSLLIVFPALSALTAFQSLPPYLRRQTHMFFELIRQVEGRVKSEYLSDFSN